MNAIIREIGAADYHIPEGNVFNIFNVSSKYRFVNEESTEQRYSHIPRGVYSYPTKGMFFVKFILNDDYKSKHYNRNTRDMMQLPIKQYCINDTPMRPRFECRFIGKDVKELEYIGVCNTSISTLFNVSAVLSFESHIKPAFRSKDLRYCNYNFLKNKKAVGGLVKHNKGKFKLSDEFQTYTCNKLKDIKLLK